MKAMILAAGHGTRMRPLTDHTPKPLLMAGGKPLIVWHIEKLAQAGFTDIVINLAWLGWQIPGALGDGSRWSVRLHYSDEQHEGALETAGGIRQALTHLDAGNDAAFLVINGDIYCDWPIHAHSLASNDLAHLVLVDNPPQHPTGDFVLHKDRVTDKPADSTTNAAHTRTFAGIGFYRPSLFANLVAGEGAKLAPLLRAAMTQGRVSGEHHPGRWEDVGTPERLALLDAELRANTAR